MPKTNGIKPEATVADVVKALPFEAKCDVVATAMEDLPDAATASVVKNAIEGLSDSETTGVAATALKTLPDDATATVVESAIRSMTIGAQGELIDRFAPDQAMTNDIWCWIVRTFAIVLLGAMIALVVAVFVSFWRKVDPAVMQMLLTIFTTTAGILAGFVSGRASTAARRP